MAGAVTLDVGLADYREIGDVGLANKIIRKYSKFARGSSKFENVFNPAEPKSRLVATCCERIRMPAPAAPSKLNDRARIEMSAN
jgi:hypothetical protein